MTRAGSSAEKLAGAEWRGRVGETWATEWARTDRSFGRLTGCLVEALDAALAPSGDGRRDVLDIGCGAGETALLLAGRRPDLDIIGLDLSADLIEVARRRSSDRPAIGYVTGDATRWRRSVPFDAALSRHGVMFFDDPVAGFAHLRSLLRPGAPLVFTCFAERAANAWASDLARLTGAPEPLDPHAPGPFAFADEDHVRRILAASGWRAAQPERVAYRYVAGRGDDPVADALSFFLRIGPAARVVAALEPRERSALVPRITDWLEAHVDEGEVVFAAAAWLWRATA